MPITIPSQIRSVDPYADHRFSNTINRLNRIYSGGEDVILPFDGQTFNLEKQTSTGSVTIAGVTYSWNANKAVKIGPGLCIKDDMLIHVKNSAYLDFQDPDNYVGSGSGYNSFDSTGKYFMLLHYEYSRSMPAPQAKYVIAKQRNEFLLNREKYIYLGTANISYTSSYIISTVVEKDVDETNSNAIIKRPNYRFVLPIVDGGDLG